MYVYIYICVCICIGSESQDVKMDALMIRRRCWCLYYGDNIHSHIMEILREYCF